MRKLLFILPVIFALLNIQAKGQDINPGIFYMPAPGPEKYYAENKGDSDSNDHSWARYQIRTGVMFNSLSGFNSVNTWLSPSVLLPVNSKFAVRIEGTFINSFYPGLGEDNERSSTSDFIMNISGIYSVNEKMNIFGNYSKSFVPGGIYGERGFESMTFGMEFMPLPNVRIGASVTSTNGINPYLMQQYYSPYRY